MDMEEEIRNHILQRHLAGEDPKRLKNDDDLILSGVLDSLAIAELAAHLKRQYRLELQPVDIVHENFGSIQALAKFVKRKMGTG